MAKENGNQGDEKEIRAISDEELNHILEENKKWYDSDREKGSPADINFVRHQYLNLKNAILIYAKIYKCDIGNSNFENALLDYANIQNTSISFSNFQKRSYGTSNNQRSIYD